VKRSTVIVNTVLGATLAVAIAGSVVVVRGNQTEPVTTEQTATVTRGDVVASVSASGNLTASTQVDADFAGAAGIVTDIFVEEGDRVRAGDRLARIDDTAARQQLAAAPRDPPSPAPGSS
jgi:membrane fusion protein, macrolide-specific efflux system